MLTGRVLLPIVNLKRIYPSIFSGDPSALRRFMEPAGTE